MLLYTRLKIPHFMQYIAGIMDKKVLALKSHQQFKMNTRGRQTSAFDLL